MGLPASDPLLTGPVRRSVGELLHSAPPEVDVAAILAEWQALGESAYRIADRHLPLPVWARRRWTEGGELAWQVLQQSVPTLDAGRAFCIYLHVPFCPGRCHFCDCYAFRLGSHREQHISGYLDVLAREMDLWSQLGNLPTRPVSTVHLGGGTPTFLGKRGLARIVNEISDRFSTMPQTEWALESTVMELSPGMLAQLEALGFTRLHIGLQTLQDDVRRCIGRRTNTRRALITIRQAVETGWIVSVDLIYGLPGQTLEGLTADIRTLAATGINGFSLYELQFSSRNRRFVQQHQLHREDRTTRYVLAQAASQLLRALGYRRSLFNHFADERDTNLYFTFPARDEDCLALGTIADGSFGDYHYRHPEYAAYRRGVGPGGPGLQGGLRRNVLENSLQPLTIALLAGRVPRHLFDDGIGRELLDRWLMARLLAPDPEGGTLSLTGSGSWFVGNMISELLDRHRTSREVGVQGLGGTA